MVELPSGRCGYHPDRAGEQAEPDARYDSRARDSWVTMPVQGMQGRVLHLATMAAVLATIAACHRDDPRASGGGIAPPARSSLCDSLGVLLYSQSAHVVTAAGDTSLADPMGGTPGWRRGCLVVLKDTTDTAGAPMQSLEQWFTAHGWVYAHYSADGPDGTVFGYAGSGRLCVVRGSWDGGDDSDSTYVPRPGFEATIACAPAVPADTASAPPPPSRERAGR